MSESPDQIRKHVEALTKFERDYGEYIAALEVDFSVEMAERARVPGEHRGAEWSADEWKRRKRQLQMDAVRADRAIKASGVGGVVFTEAPAAGGGIRSADLPSQIFDFIEVGFGFTDDDGMSFQRKLLERMPSQIAGLEVRLEDAESAPSPKPPPPQRPLERGRGAGGWQRWAWVNHPWTIAIGSGIFLLAVGLLVAAMH